MTNAILDFLGIAQTYDPGKFSNIEAATGISPIAGLGYDVSPPIDILIENQLNPDVTNAPASKNHSQQVLTDTLAVYSLYSQLLPSFDQNQLNSLINAFGSIKDTQGTSNSTTLESALDALRTIVLNPGEGQIILDDTHKTGRGDREAFYTNFESLNGNQALLTLSGTAQLTLLSELNANQIITMAIDNGAQGMAARFALSALNPFVLEGIDYSAFNNNNVLDLFNPASGAGMISDQYLEDRVTMLVRKLWFNTNDENPYNPSAQVDSHNFNIHQYLKSDIYFEDAATGYKIQQGGLLGSTLYYFLVLCSSYCRAGRMLGIWIQIREITPFLPLISAIDFNRGSPHENFPHAFTRNNHSATAHCLCNAIANHGRCGSRSPVCD
jgi:hypothetical protein